MKKTAAMNRKGAGNPPKFQNKRLPKDGPRITPVHAIPSSNPAIFAKFSG